MTDSRIPERESFLNRFFNHLRPINYFLFCLCFVSVFLFFSFFFLLLSGSTPSSVGSCGSSRQESEGHDVLRCLHQGELFPSHFLSGVVTTSSIILHFRTLGRFLEPVVTDEGSSFQCRPCHPFKRELSSIFLRL